MLVIGIRAHFVVSNNITNVTFLFAYIMITLVTFTVFEFTKLHIIYYFVLTLNLGNQILILSMLIREIEMLQSERVYKRQRLALFGFALCFFGLLGMGPFWGSKCTS